MSVKVVLVDVNPKMVKAWREVFADNPEVTVAQGSILDQEVDAWVSPTNARGSMDGGLDGVIKKHLGAKIQLKVQAEIARLYQGNLPIGHATCVETGGDIPRFLVSTAIMGASGEDISDTLNVALACSAALQRVHMANAATTGLIRTVALPGLGTNVGKVPPDICADLMWTAYDLFKTQSFADFSSMRIALEQRLGALGNAVNAAPARPAPAALAHAAAPKGPVIPSKVTGPMIPTKYPVVPPKPAAPYTAPKAKQLDDFDDHE